MSPMSAHDDEPGEGVAPRSLDAVSQIPTVSPEWDLEGAMGGGHSAVGRESRCGSSIDQHESEGRTLGPARGDDPGAGQLAAALATELAGGLEGQLDGWLVS